MELLRKTRRCVKTEIERKTGEKEKCPLEVGFFDLGADGNLRPKNDRHLSPQHVSIAISAEMRGTLRESEQVLSCLVFYGDGWSLRGDRCL